MESRLVREFVDKTGADTAVAYNTLSAKGWDLSLALQSFRLSGPSHSLRWSNSAPPVAEENGNSDEASSSSSQSRPPLQKADSVDITECKKLTRGISRATDNVNLVSKARCNIAHDFTENTVCNVNQYFIETPVYTFTLPDLTIYPEEFRCFLEKDLIELSSLASLEQSGRLNWWAESGACQRLWPLATTGDGNCLLHAASLGMWGFHDRLLTLRKALHGFMSHSECKEALWRRWRWQQTRLNSEAGFVYSEDEWLREWAEIVAMASTEPRKVGGARRRSMVVDREALEENATYESLEEIHVLALAHVLRRTIIVVADRMLKDVHGEDLAPILFGGIYLPLECSPADCHRSPLVLTYDAAHFSALVVMETETFDKTAQPPAVIPLTDSDHLLLTLQFSIDPGAEYAWDRDDTKPSVAQRLALAEKQRLTLLRDYLDVIDVSLTPLTPLDDEEDIDKRYVEVIESGLMDDGLVFNNKPSKAAKQLQSVVVGLGSIGKSMSKRIKKNLGSIGKLARTNSQKKDAFVARRQPSSTATAPRSSNTILCASLHTDQRHEYQAEMIRNYLMSAQARFLQGPGRPSSGPVKCINPGCGAYGTALTSYMCRQCFETQRNEEMAVNSPVVSRANNSAEPTAARYGAGRSRFYTNSDRDTLSAVSQLPGSRAGTNTDHTLYLCRSTFYDDTAQSPGVARRDTRSSQWNNRCSQQDPSARQASRLHSYNLSRTWDSPRGSPHASHERVIPITLDSDSESSSQRDRNVSLVQLSAHNTGSVELPGVERVELPAVNGGVWVNGAQPCRTDSCKFYGRPESDYFCSKCHREMSAAKMVRVVEVKR